MFEFALKKQRERFGWLFKEKELENERNDRDEQLLVYHDHNRKVKGKNERKS